jgi:hypothetical protein
VFNLNPGLQGTFVWLSQIAQNFEEYEFVQLIFHYRSTVSDATNNTSGQVGVVIMATSYNAANPNFTDKQQMVEYAHSHSCRITEHMSHGVECDPRKNALSPILYIRANPVVTNQDLKTYDLGKFQIAVSNCPTAYNGYPIGELWVEYRCELRKPKLWVSRGLEVDQDYFTMTTASAVTQTQAILGTASFNVGTPTSTTITPSATASNANLPNGSPVILYSVQNNIGATVCWGQDTAGTPKWHLGILLPASYTGALSISIILNSTTSGTGYLPELAVDTPIGNITPINDIYPASGATNTLITTRATVTSSASTYGLIQHLFVTAATQGQNNFWSCTVSAGTFTGAFATSIKIEQYNNFGLSNSSQRLQWYNATQTLTTP